MPKKSHRVAARQQAVSRERKRKKKPRAQAPQVRPTSPPPAATPSIEPRAAEPATEEAATVTMTQPTPLPRTVASRYLYVITELRKIAIISAAALVILIILAFVLG
jgi:hypothetical protein